MLLKNKLFCSQMLNTVYIISFGICPIVDDDKDHENDTKTIRAHTGLYKSNEHNLAKIIHVNYSQ